MQIPAYYKYNIIIFFFINDFYYFCISTALTPTFFAHSSATVSFHTLAFFPTTFIKISLIITETISDGAGPLVD